jgi:hypothetical protein
MKYKSWLSVLRLRRKKRGSAQDVDNKTKNCPARWRRAVGVFNYSPVLYWFGNHIFKQYFKRHGVSASLMGKEKFAIAVKNAFIIGNMVFAIITVKINFELGEVKTVPVFSVPFCFFNLAYQSRIHCINLLF